MDKLKEKIGLSASTLKWVVFILILLIYLLMLIIF